MSGRLAGKVAIVTGGGTGYGFGIASKLKEEGAEVVIADISEANGSKAAQDLKGTFVKADITNRSHWESILEKTISTYGKLDIVVNNAGVCYDAKPTETVSEKEFNFMFDVNVKGFFQSTSVLIPHFLEKKQEAVFVNVASVSAMRPRPQLTWYAASKAAMNVANNAMAVEYGPQGIRFNTVCPVVGATSMSVSLVHCEGHADVFPAQDR